MCYIKIMRKIYLLLVFLLISLVAAPSVRALEEFKTDFIVTYQIDTRGNASIEQNITLTNNFANIYSKEYVLETTQNLKNISAWDEKGSILNEIEQKEGATRLRLEFNQEVVGKGKSLNFTVRYTLPQLAVRKGRVWEIVVPQISNYQKISSFLLELFVPNSFGKLAYSSARIKKTENLGTRTKFTLTKEELKDKTSILSFGDFQSLDFSLNYHLANVDPGFKKAELAVPPQTNYQEIVFTKMVPLPEEIKKDINNNWLAVYLLPPNKELNVLVEGQAKIFAWPQKADFYNLEENLDLFLNEDRFWEASHPKIIELAKRLRSVKKIYQFVVSHLKYDYQTVERGDTERKGALATLEDPEQSVCSEFTDLFIALCRGAGIPAREIEGFAYTNNPKLKPLSLKKDVLHAWPEYWDQHKKEWVQVDPTWEKTTGGVDYFDNFDFNHLAFVIHGNESNLPPPPGSYFLDKNGPQKNVTVVFSNQQIITPSLEELFRGIEVDFQKTNGEIIVKNTSFFPIAEIYLKNYFEENEFKKDISLLPPLGKEPTIINTPPWWKQLIFNPQLNVAIGNESAKIEKPFQFKILSQKEVAGRQIFLISFGAILGLGVIMLIVKLIARFAKKH